MPIENTTFSIYTTIFLTASCKKDNNPAQFFIRCKIDGKDYRPNNCANCMRGQLLGDTTFLLNANAGFESVAIGIIKLDKIPISPTTYVLKESPQQNGIYDNSPEVVDIFKTDANRTGVLTISKLDKSSKIVEGTFTFPGFNSAQNKTVSITKGEFRLKYTDGFVK